MGFHTSHTPQSCPPHLGVWGTGGTARGGVRRVQGVDGYAHLHLVEVRVLRVGRDDLLREGLPPLPVGKGAVAPRTTGRLSLGEGGRAVVLDASHRATRGPAAPRQRSARSRMNCSSGHDTSKSPGMKVWSTSASVAAQPPRSCWRMRGDADTWARRARFKTDFVGHKGLFGAHR